MPDENKSIVDHVSEIFKGKKELTLPLEGIENLELVDIIDIKEIQSILDDFCKSII